MGKKILSGILVVLLAFLAGFGGAKLALQQTGSKKTTIEAFGQKIEIGQESKVPQSLDPAPHITIDYKDINDDLALGEVIAEKVLPSVVGVKTTYEGQGGSSYQSLMEDFFGWGWGFGGLGGGSTPQKREYSSVGTGVIVDGAGYILTNSHVVNDGTFKEIEISLYDGRTAKAELLWNDSSMDVAILKIDEKNLTAAELGNSDTVRVGAYAAAIGNPLGLDYERSMTQGIISGLNRTITVSGEGSTQGTTMENLIQTDATINSGNSGGPLLNSKGLVIGINTARASEGENMGFAIPINAILPIVNQIKEKGSFERAYLGISGVGLYGQGYSESQLEEEFGVSSGIYVASVSENGGAKKAGLKEGDVITKVNGQEVGTMNKINTILVKYNIGDTVELEYVRDKETKTAKVTLTGM